MAAAPETADFKGWRGEEPMLEGGEVADLDPSFSAGAGEEVAEEDAGVGADVAAGAFEGEGVALAVVLLVVVGLE